MKTMKVLSRKTAAVAFASSLAMALPPAHAASHNPPTTASNRFSLEIDGVPVSQLTHVDFLRGVASQAAAGAGTVALLRLTRLLGGTQGSATDFVKWRQQIAAGRVDSRSLSLIFLSTTGTEAARLNLFSCSAVSWSGPDVAAANGEKPVAESVDVGCLQVEMKGTF
jgi:hypothetical protein